MTDDATPIVLAAIHNTPADYWSKLCRSRAEHDAERVGSYILRATCADVDRIIRSAAWLRNVDPLVAAPARSFFASGIDGRLGIVPIELTPAGAHLEWADAKDTGKVECLWRTDEEGPACDTVVLIIGPDDDGTPIVWTFHPGDPIPPSAIDRHYEFPNLSSWHPHAQCHRIDRHGRRTSHAEALELGVRWVKLAPTKEEAG